MAKEHIHPYTFDRLPVRKPWAGTLMSRVYQDIADGLPELTGETAEVADVPELETRINNGIASGMTLADLSKKLGEGVYARDVLGGESEVMPLMLKYLDTAAPLSVQVHPSDRKDQYGNLSQLGKSEAWLLLHAQPGACVYQAKRPEVDVHTFWQQVMDGDPARVMNEIPVQRGDFLNNPSGLVHSIGAGLLILEIQQSNNTTYRLRDWPGTAAAEEKRTLHVNDAKRVTRINMPAERKINAMDAHARESAVTGRRNSAVVLRDEYPFRCYSLRVEDPMRLRSEIKPRLRLLTCLEGQVLLTVPTPSGSTTLRLVRGQTTMIPAICRDVDVYPEEPAWLLESAPV